MYNVKLNMKKRTLLHQILKEQKFTKVRKVKGQCLVTDGTCVWTPCREKIQKHLQVVEVLTGHIRNLYPARHYKGDGWLVGSASAFYGSSKGSNPNISQKYKVSDISTGVANTLNPANKIY
jgi:hypothetical protein